MLQLHDLACRPPAASGSSFFIVATCRAILTKSVYTRKTSSVSPGLELRHGQVTNGGDIRKGRRRRQIAEVRQQVLAAPHQQIAPFATHGDVLDRDCG